MSHPAASPDDGRSPFDQIKRVEPDGSESWWARDLQQLMAYPRWADFKVHLRRAMLTAKNTGLDVDTNFRPTRAMRQAAPGGDYELSRQGARLLTLSADPAKPQVAAAQAYFTATTSAE